MDCLDNYPHVRTKSAICLENFKKIKKRLQYLQTLHVGNFSRVLSVAINNKCTQNNNKGTNAD